MLHTVLLILKIFGIVLLCILGILVLLLLSVLFVPVRYRLLARKTETVWAKARVSWFFHILSAVFLYSGGGPANLVLRIFGIPVYDMRRREAREKARQEKAREKMSRKKKRPDKKKQEPLSDADIPPQTDSAAQITHMDQTADGPERDKTGAKTREEEPVQEEKQSLAQRIREFFSKIFQALKNIEYTIRALCDRIKKAAGQASYYKEIWESEECVRAFSLCKGQLSRVIRNIKPSKFRLYVKVGSQDPEITGKLLSWYGMAYPFVYRNIRLQPYFDRDILEGELYCKGKVTFFVMLRAAWVIYFNKNIKKLLKLLKKEEG